MNFDFLSGIGDAIGSFFASPIVQLGLKAIGIYIIIIWLAAAFWAFRDLQLRTANPILPYLAAAFVIGFTPILFLFAVVVYKIIRPQERLGEAYERGLAEEALLAEIAAIEHCATCGRKVHEEWILCPTCRTRLKRVCRNCNRLVGFEWSLCAWCGRDFDRPVGAIGPVRTPAPRAEDVPALRAEDAPAPAPVTAPVAPAASVRARRTTQSAPSPTKAGVTAPGVTAPGVTAPSPTPRP
jgi:RNA polymerase subunit RPABC4/transcription elongation factor Spt4